MSNDRSIAVKLMSDAARHVGKDRGPQHGSTEPSFRMIAELWSTHINHATARATDIQPMPEVHLTAWDVSQMMVMLKLARSLYGDRALAEHYSDAIGYASLAGMLASPDKGVPDALPIDPEAVVAVPDQVKEPVTEIPSFLKKDRTNAS